MNRVDYNIKELTNYVVNSFTLTESINGKLPTGTLNITQSKEDVNLDLTELNISLIVNCDYELTMIGNILSASDFQGNIIYELCFLPKEFYTNLEVVEHSGLSSLIDKAYPYEIVGDKSNDSDLDSITIYQNSVTNKSILDYYLPMMKKDKVFTYRFESLKFTDLTADKPLEMDMTYLSKELVLKVSKSKYLEIEATAADLPVNGLTLISYNGDIITCDTRMSKGIQNKLYNDNRLGYFMNGVDHEFPLFTGLRAGDIVQAMSLEFENNVYLVTSYSLEVTRNKQAIEIIKLGAI